MAEKKAKKVMRITRERALKLFSYFNYKTASKWDSKRMEGKLMKLPEMVDINLVKNDKVEAVIKEIMGASSVEVISTKEKTKTKDATPEKKKEAPKAKTPEKKKKVSKKKTDKKKTTKKVGKSNKEKIYESFLKVKLEKASDHVEKWWKMVNKEVKLSTIKSWVNRWKKGKGLPGCAKKGK